MCTTNDDIKNPTNEDGKDNGTETQKDTTDTKKPIKDTIKYPDPTTGIGGLSLEREDSNE